MRRRFLYANSSHMLYSCRHNAKRNVQAVTNHGITLIHYIRVDVSRSRGDSKMLSHYTGVRALPVKCRSLDHSIDEGIALLWISVLR